MTGRKKNQIFGKYGIVLYGPQRYNRGSFLFQHINLNKIFLHFYIICVSIEIKMLGIFILELTFANCTKYI